MAIPKVIYQTFKTHKLPFLTRWFIYRLKKNNPNYRYEFYDDARIEEFFKNEFPADVLKAYWRLNIGAAKADMFRYAILLKYGGVYLDIDSYIPGKLDEIIKDSDSALVSLEKDPGYYVQWALVFEAGHPIMKRTFELLLDNIQQNKFPNDVHAMTGPTIYTQAVDEYCADYKDAGVRFTGRDYDGKMKFKYRFNKILLYGGSKADHWKKKQLTTPVLKPID